MTQIIKSVTMVLALACLSSVGTSKSLLTDIKTQPSYLVMDDEGTPGVYSSEGSNTIQMDCTGCFPEGRIVSMKIKDITKNCKSNGNTSHNKNKAVATIYCRPCGNYDLKVSAKVVIEGVTECVERIFKYKKDACPSNAADVTASPQVAKEKSFEIGSSNNGSSLSKTVPVATEIMGRWMGSSLSREDGVGDKESNARSSGNQFEFSAAIITVLSVNLSFMLYVFN